jgi:predicted permease
MPIAKDVRFSLRQLRKTPVFTAVVLATLGLCIGVNTAIYSVLDAVLLRPIPYPKAERLGLMVTAARGKNGAEYINDSQNGALFETVRDNVRPLELAAWAGTSGVNFAGEGRLEFVQQQRVSAGYFHVLGVPPQYGREFSRAEDVTGGPPLVILSDAFWQRVFHGDAAAIGRAITLRGEPYTIVGIMPASFRATGPVDVWTPLRPSRTGEGGGSNYGVVARIEEGTTWAAVTDQLKALSVNLKQSPAFREYGTEFEERIVPLQKGMTADSRSQLWLTWGAVLIVLVIGCVNIAGLMLARSGARQREIATRMALGGSRSAIVRQLLTESMLLALGGCALGVGLGVKALAWLKDLGAENMQMWHPIEIDLRVLGAMLAISIVTSVLFGLAPAIQTSRVDLRAVLVEGGRGVAGGRRRWWQNALVACEVALSLVLLVSAGLLVRTLGYLNGLNPGFDDRGVITAQASLQDARYKTGTAVNRLFTQSLERIRTIPGVESAGVALTLPFERPLNSGFRTMDGIDTERHGVEMVYVTPGYFETLRMPVRHGRTIRESDTPEAAQVAIVSESFARKYYGGREALGGHLNMGRNEVREIVGVVGDVQQHSGMGNFGPLSINPTVYVPAAQVADSFLQLVHTWFSPKWAIRTASGSAIQGAVQAAIANIDPQLPIARFRTIDDLRGRMTQEQRYNATLFSAIAGLALLLSALGLSGLIAQSVSRRTHELGVRMALGASAGQAMMTTMKPGLLLAGAGVIAGYGLSRVAVRLLEHSLWGVKSTDATTFAGAAAILVVVAGLAALVPSVRILRIDPAKTLRDE